MKIATKIMRQWHTDNMVFDYIIERSAYQTHVPVQVDQNYTGEHTAYIYEDGSALINENESWRVKSNYGLSPDNQKY